MKYYLFALVGIFPFLVFSQDYVDLATIGYGQTFNNSFEGTSESTYVRFFDADITVPVVLNDNHAAITGVSFSRNNLQLFPDTDYTNLYSTTLKVGLASTWSEKWSTTIVLLPKAASDYQKVEGEDIYFGGFGLLKMKKSEQLLYRFGLYASEEAFGLFSTPIVGAYYKSPNNRFEMDLSLPILANINYCLGSTTVGVDYFGIGRSFRLYGEEEQSDTYVDFSSLDFSAYLQFNTLQKSLLLRAKAGYSSSNYEVYATGEKIDLGLSAFSFGDERQRLNPEMNGSIFVKIEAVYRFHINSEVSKKQDTRAE